jgi:RimJ/RimL family protein N-acetyltransferase
VEISDLKIRKALTGDSLEILRWRNDPETIKFSLGKKNVTVQEHEEWFRKNLESRTNFIYVGTVNHLLVGVVRFSNFQDKSNFKVSINISPETRSFGLGIKLINLAEQELKHEIGSCILTAIALKINVRSLSFFSKCKYELHSETEETVEFRKILA